MKGVHYDSKRKKYWSSITIGGQRIFLGRFKTEQEAMKVRDKTDVILEIGQVVAICRIKKMLELNYDKRPRAQGKQRTRPEYKIR